MKLLCLLLATALCTHAAASDPGAAAIEFLEKIRTGKLDLSPGTDTAITPQTADRKKDEISTRISRIAKDLGQDPLQLSSVKIDENFAAVLVKKISSADPSRLQIFPIAMVKRDSKWYPAPVPASFENTGVGFAIPLKNRLQSLENWMLREQVLQIEKLRKEAEKQLRLQIQSRLPIEKFRRLDSNQLAELLLTAFETRDLPAILGLFGGLSQKLPQDWPIRLKATRLALAGELSNKTAWDLLLAPRVLRLLIPQESTADDGIFSIACLDPASKDSRTSLPRIVFVHFQFQRDQTLTWQIDPPSSLLEEHHATDGEVEDDLDSDLLNSFSVQWEKSHPPIFATSAEQAQESFFKSLQHDGLASFLQLITLSEDPAAARQAMQTATKLWWSFRAPTAVAMAIPLHFTKADDSAMAQFQQFSAKEPDRLNLQKIYFHNSESGWSWTPDPDEQMHKLFELDAANHQSPTNESWQSKLLVNSILLDQLPNLPAPDEATAKQTVTAFLKATAAGDLSAALKLTARLKDPKGNGTLLRNLGYEITTARRQNIEATFLSTYVGKHISTIAGSIEQNGQTTFPLYPVVQTVQGPRVLLEIDLFARRNQALLNRIALERLGKLGSKAAAEDLEIQLEKFEKTLPSEEIRRDKTHLKN